MLQFRTLQIEIILHGKLSVDCTDVFELIVFTDLVLKPRKNTNRAKPIWRDVLGERLTVEKDSVKS